MGRKNLRDNWGANLLLLIVAIAIINAFGRNNGRRKDKSYFRGERGTGIGDSADDDSDDSGGFIFAGAVGCLQSYLYI